MNIQIDSILTSERYEPQKLRSLDVDWCICDQCYRKNGCIDESCADYIAYTRMKTNKARKKHYDNFIKLQSLSMRLMGYENTKY